MEPATIRHPSLDQPAPEETIVSYVKVSGRTATSIQRTWAEGEEASCHLCPEEDCTARRGVCSRLFNFEVAPDEAPLFSARSLHIARRGHDERRRDAAGR